jgi:hypothetical protein
MFPVRVSVFSDRPQHARVRKTAAQNAAEGDTDVLVGGSRFSIQNGLRGEDHAAQAESTLRRPFLNKRLLERVRLLRRAEAFECGDFLLPHRLHRHYARSHRLAPYDDRARSALRHPAAKSRAPQTQVVSKNEQERCVWIDVHDVMTAVDPQRDLLHELRATSRKSNVTRR